MCEGVKRGGGGGLIEGLRGCDIHVRGRNLDDCNPLFISSLMHISC